MSERAARWGLILVLAAYLLLGGVFSLFVPLGQAPDEADQFELIRYMLERRKPPRTAQERLTAGGTKGDEPPLYYAILAVATGWVDSGSPCRVKMLDPDLQPRHSLPDEVLINYAPLHTADEEWPFRGQVLQWHLARLLTLALAAATLWVAYRVMRLLCPRRPELALLAITVAALNPQYVYIGSTIQSDILVALMASLLVWILVRLARGDTRWRQFVFLGVLVGLSRLTKFSTLVFLPEVILIVLVLAWRQRQARLVPGLLLALVLSVAVSAPWLFYIKPLDPTIQQGITGKVLTLFDIVRVERWFSPHGEGTVGSGLPAILRALTDALRLGLGRWASYLFKSYWAYFGPMTVEAPGPVYVVVGMLTGVALLGWARILADRLSRRFTVIDACQDLWIPALHLAAVLGMEVAFFGALKALPYTAQGRHLFPAMVGLTLFLALGWSAIWPRSTSAPATAGLAVLLAGLSLYCLPTVVHSISRPPLPVCSSPWPDAPSPSQSMPLGDGLVFAGARWSVGRPGSVQGTLYWTASEPPTGEAVVVLELLDAEGAVRAVWAGHPGGARYPTQAWDAGDHVRQQFSWPLPTSFSVPARTLRMRVLREGVQVTSLDLPFELPVGSGPASDAPTSLATAGLRDSLLFTIAGGHIEGLVGPDGSVWHPLARTAAGDQAAFVVDARMRPGDYTLRVAGTQPAGGALRVKVEGRPRTFETPSGLNPVGAVLGGNVELVGYDLGGTRVAPGGTLHLRLVWRARGRVDRHYTVFTHLVDGQGHTWAQHDKLPGQEYSTLFWAPGEVVVDEYTLRVDPAAPAGEYRVEVGLYQALTGARAPVLDAQGQPAGDYLTLGPVQVGP